MTSRAVKVNLTLTSTKANAPQTNTTSGTTTNTKSNNKINTSKESTTPSSAMNKMPNETNVPQDLHIKHEDKQQGHTLQKTNINATKISVNNTEIKETTSKQKEQHQEAATTTTKTRSPSPVTITIRSNNGLRVNNTKANSINSVNITNKNSEKQNNIVLAKAQQQHQKQQHQMTGNSKKSNNQIIVKEQRTSNNSNMKKTSKDVNSKEDTPNAQLLSLSAIPHRHVSILPSPVPSASLEHVVNDKSPYSNTSIPIKSNIKSNVNNKNNNNKNNETMNQESNNTNNTVKPNTTKQFQEKDKLSSLEPTNLNVTTPVTLEKASHVQTHSNNTTNNKINNVANTNTNMTLQQVTMTSTPEKEILTEDVQKETSVTKPQKQRMRRRQTPSRNDRVMFQEVIATSVVKASRRSHNKKVNNCTKSSVNTNSVDEKPITSELAKKESNVRLDSPAQHNGKTNNISNEVETKKICNNSSTQTDDLNTHANCKTENTKAASVVDKNKENKDNDIIHRLIHQHQHHRHKGKRKVRAKEGEVQTEEEHVSQSIAQNHKNKTENVKHVNNNNNISKKANDSKANRNKCAVKENASVQTMNSSFGDDDDKLEEYKTDGEQDEESNDSNSSESKSYSEDEDNNNNNNNNNNKAEKVHGVNKQNINTNEHKSKSQNPVHVQFPVDGSNDDDDDDEIDSYDSSSINDYEEEENPLRWSNNNYTTEDKQENRKELHAEETKEKTKAEPLSAHVDQKAQYDQERHPCFVNTNPVHQNTNVQEQEELHGLYYEKTAHPEKKHHKYTTTSTHHHHHHHHHKRQERVVHFLDALFAPDYTEKMKSLPVSSHETAACKYTSEQPMLPLNFPPPIPVQSTSTSFYRNAINTNAHTIVHNMNITEEYTYEELRTQQLALEEPLFLYYSSLHAAVHLYPGDYVTIEPILNNTTIAATHANTFHTNTTTTSTNNIPTPNNYNHNCAYPPPYKYGFYRFANNSNAANSQTLFNYSFPTSQSAFPLQQQQQQYQQQEMVITQNNSDTNVIINNNQTIANNANKEAMGDTTTPVAQAQAQAQTQAQIVTTNVNSQPQQQQQQQQNRVPIQLT